MTDLKKYYRLIESHPPPLSPQKLAIDTHFALFNPNPGKIKPTYVGTSMTSQVILLGSVYNGPGTFFWTPMIHF